MNLALSFDAIIYVPEFVYYSQDIQDTITSTFIKTIEDNLSNRTISFTNIISDTKNILSEYIDSIDVAGINDETTLQTLIVEDSSTKPMIKNKLVYTNSTYRIEKDVQIEYKLSK
jgi:hypothetical protein